MYSLTASLPPRYAKKRGILTQGAELVLDRYENKLMLKKGQQMGRDVLERLRARSATCHDGDLFLSK